MKNFADLCQYLIHTDTIVARVLTFIGHAAARIAFDLLVTIWIIVAIAFICGTSLALTLVGSTARKREFEPSEILEGKLPLSLPYLVGLFGLALIVGNIAWAGFISTVDNGLIVSRTSTLGWTLHGIGCLLICIATCSIAPIATVHAISKKTYFAAVGYVLCTLVIGTTCFEPIATSLVEVTCRTNCHAQFIANLAADEAIQAKYDRENPCDNHNCVGANMPPRPATQWATNTFIFTNVVTLIGTLMLALLTGFTAPTINQTRRVTNTATAQPTTS